MTFVIKSICQNRIIIGLLLWFRGLLLENKIPDTLFDRLKNYTSELSVNIPDIEAVNKCLEYDIGFLNSKEEFINIKSLKGKEKRKEALFNLTPKTIESDIIKYYAVKIVSYQDIIEIDAIRDRVFFIDIDMDIQNRIYNFFYKNTESHKDFYYSIKLSTLESMF